MHTKNGYRLIYAFEAQPGTVLIQEVTTRVQYLCGDEPWADFTSVFAEYFSVGEGGTTSADDDELLDMRDVHAFDLARDGWTLSALRKLFRKQGVQNAEGRPCKCRQPARITCEKRFLIAPGTVENSPPLKVNGDQSFGFLLEGPRGPARASLELSGGEGGTRSTLAPRSPFPYGSDGAGRGRFVGDAGYALTERFAFAFGTDSLTFDDGGGYQALSLSRAD